MTIRGDDRRYEMHQPVRLGDATRDGRLRLDALARYLQDVATEDTAEVDMPKDRGWVLRRMAWDLGRLPTIYEDLVLETRCSGVGGRWAERTTTIAGVDGLNDDGSGLRHGVLITARAVWVSIGMETGVPQALSPEFFAAYGDAIRTQKVSARLTHPGPPVDARRIPWPLRSTDIDVFGHVNNALYWVPVEDYLADAGRGRKFVGATIEFGAGIDPGDECDLVVEEVENELAVWFVVGDSVRASIRAETRSSGT